MKYCAALLAAALAFAPFVGAQASTPDDLLARARATYDQEGAKPALPQFEAALAAYRQAGDRRGEAISLNWMGNCHKHLGDTGRALEFLQASLAIKRELHDNVEQAKTLNNIGLIYWEQARYGDAIASYESARKLAAESQDARIEGAVLNNLGLAYKERGQYREAFDRFQEAVARHRTAHFDRGESDALGNLGGWYLDLGHYAEALKQYQDSTAIAEKAGLKPSVMQNLGNMGLSYTALGRVPEAISAFDRAAAMAAEEGSKREEGDWHKGKGSALAQVGKYDDALQEFAAADRIYGEIGSAQQRVEVLNDRGGLYLTIGDLASAGKEFTQARQAALRIRYAQGLQSALLNLSELSEQRGQLEKARGHLVDALEQSRRSGDDAGSAAASLRLASLDRRQKRFAAAETNAQQAKQLAHTTGAPLLEARAAAELGHISLARGNAAAGLARFQQATALAEPLADSELKWQIDYAVGQAYEASGRFADAIDAYRRAVQQIESVRGQLREERFRAGYLQSRYEVYIALVRLLIKLHRLGDAFSYSEKLRARSYLDVIVESADTDSAELAELRARIRHLQAAILAEQAKARSEQRSGMPAYSDELAKAEARYQELMDDLRGRLPEWRRVLQVSSAGEIGSALPADAAVLEYVVGPASTSLLCITPRALRGTLIPIGGANLTAKVELLRDLIRDAAHDHWRAPAQSLYRELIGPAAAAGWLRGVHQLYVVPHGILHYLPFAALEQASSAGERFLVQQYTLKELPSASLLVTGAAPAAGTAASLLSVAPAHAHLAFAANEAQSVAQLFPGRSTVLAGTSATKDRFTRIAGNYDLLHLATHGYFDRLNPMFSGIQLEPAGGDDGTLRVYEILALRLHARLVTLSACETALAAGFFSDLPPGDEFVGLTRAFLSAGSRSVMATLWDVNDRATTRFMVDFYRRIGRADSTLALARAQRAMAEQGAYRHPYYWAAFVLNGEGR